jgi:hypothetical protein
MVCQSELLLRQMPKRIAATARLWCKTCVGRQSLNIHDIVTYAVQQVMAVVIPPNKEPVRTTELWYIPLSISAFGWECIYVFEAVAEYCFSVCQAHRIFSSRFANKNHHNVVKNLVTTHFSRTWLMDRKIIALYYLYDDYLKIRSCALKNWKIYD